MNEKTLLKVENLSVEFIINRSKKKAIRDINFNLNKGEILGIVGESGSGKSVTALSAMRLIAEPVGKISKGKIILNVDNKNIDLVQLSEKKMREIRGNDISMIFQEPMTSLNPVYTCGEQIVETILQHDKYNTQTKIYNTINFLWIFFLNFILSILNIFSFSSIKLLKRKRLTKKKKIARIYAMKLLDKVKLKNIKTIYNSYPHQISGGQIQRVMIAMALSGNPSILIADEPTTALDVNVQKSIIELLKDIIKETNIGIIFVSHDLALISELCDQLIVMYNGSIVEEGKTKDVYSNPKHPYTRGLLACKPPLKLKLRRLATRNSFMEVDEDGLLCDIDISIEEVLNNLKLSKTEIEQSNKKIYASKTIFEVKNLSKIFVKKRTLLGKTLVKIKALDNINLKVFEGESLGIVGSSGCGKTSLGRAMLKLIRINSGQIIYNGKDITNLSPRKMSFLRKDMQIIFQDPYSSLNPKIRVGNAILEPMKIHKILNNDLERKEEILNLLKKVGLKEEHYNRYPHEFSGGQRQRICIARAIALKPKFILCDESVSALDVSVQAEVLNLLKELKEQYNLTYIFISHDLSVVNFISDRIIVMDKGKIIEEGLTQDIYNKPKHKKTQELILSIPKTAI